MYRAFENHTITSFVDDYTDVRIGSHSESASSMKLNRLFGLFVANKSTSPVKNPTVLHALAYFIDRDAIIDATMSGYATPRIGVLDMSFDDLGEPVVFNPNKGYQILADAGWTLDKKTGMLVSSLETSSDQFSFTLATSNAPHLIAIAEYLQQSLGTYGIKVTLDIYTSDVLLEEIIPKRSFDVLLFGVSIPFPGSISSYWHSSQRNDPGRNITQYTNAGTDKILEQAHSEHNLEKRIDMYNEFNRQISTDQPALMLYAPNIIYETPKKLHHSLPAVIDTPKERFNMIHTWFIHKTQVWSWFNQKNKRTL